MNITFLAPCKDLSGGIKVIATYAEGLRKRGHQVTVVYPQKQESLKRRVKTIALRTLRQERDHLDAFGGTLLPVPAMDNSHIPDADVLVATAWETAEWAQKLSETKGKKYYLIQGHEVWNADKESVYATYAYPMKKITISSWLHQLVSRQVPQHNITTIRNGVDALFRKTVIPQDKRNYDAGFVYSVIPNKGSDLSLTAMRLLVRQNPKLRFVIFGTEKPVEQLPPNTDFFLKPSPKKIASIYANTKVWLSSSYEEGFCLPCLEAMTSGCVVVSTDNKGVRDIIQDGRNGFITLPGRSEDLLKRASELLEDEALRTSFSKSGRLRSKHFTWSAAVDEFETLLLSESAMEVAA